MIAPTRHQQFWLILQNVLHVGNIQIQMVQLKYFKVPLPMEILVMTVTDNNPNFPQPCPGIEIHIVTSAFESAELIQDLFLARLIPKLRGCIIIGLARSNKYTVKKEEFSGKKSYQLTICCAKPLLCVNLKLHV